MKVAHLIAKMALVMAVLYQFGALIMKVKGDLLTDYVAQPGVTLY